MSDKRRDIDRLWELFMSYRKSWSSVVFTICVALLAVIGIIVLLFELNSINDERLFNERGAHLDELASKVAENIDTIVKNGIDDVNSIAAVIDDTGYETPEEMTAGIGRYYKSSGEVFIAVDDANKAYMSDGTSGNIEDGGLLDVEEGETAVKVGILPGFDDDDRHIVFISRLDAPLTIGDSRIEYIALAADMDALDDNFNVSGYGDSMYSYIIDPNGDFIYHCDHPGCERKADNLFMAFQDASVHRGATAEELDAMFKNHESVCVEIENGGELSFVVTGFMKYTDWSVVLTVPTDALSTDNDKYVRDTMRVFGAMAGLLVIIMASFTTLFMKGKSDRAISREREITNVKLTQAAEKAEAASMAKSNFLNSMSHDIRTPMNAITGMTAIALSHLDDRAKVESCLRKIESSSDHLLSLINDVLDMSRIESGKVKLNHAPMDVRTCLDNCSSIISGQLLNRNIEFVREFGRFNHPHVFADELRLRQVFINILGNAVKFTLDGGRIVFRAEETASNDTLAYYRFEFEDSGIGMSEEYLGKIWDAFSQEEDGARTNYKGTGLGMSITKQFVDMMGGTIEVTSERNVGSKFVVELAFAIDTAPAEVGYESVKLPEMKGMRVLLAEDNAINAEIAEELLSEKAIIMELATDGEKAVEMFNDNPPDYYDAILMDIMMPNMNGLVAAQTIRSMDRDDAQSIPIFALTANAYADDIRKSTAAGMNAHLSKPIDPDALFKTLADVYINKTHRNALRNKKVLLAEDDDLNAEIAVELLSDQGAEVSVAANGSMACEMYLNGDYDIILMDVNMPVMNGLEAAKAIRESDREDAKSIPIFGMTASTDPDDLRATIEAGMNANVEKPINISRLKKTVYDFSDQN